MNQAVDLYLQDGCGRCKFYATPKCKVNTWREELVLLRQIVLSTGLKEELKWSFPCYTFESHNVVMIAAFKDYCAVSFFKGALLKDNDKLLSSHGSSSQAVRIIKFLSVDEIIEKENKIKEYIQNAINNELKGLKIQFKKNPEPIPAELMTALDKFEQLKTAFNALTPGKQRSYILYISQAKQTVTREKRVEQCIPKILRGEAFLQR
ncbi:MAG TPA: YdeI/OmpD-associated family protein [Saprospiraceae bacterium]|nr:YdeI/OmpD-associated family protein [Saprospiraceae bacterium]